MAAEAYNATGAVRTLVGNWQEERTARAKVVGLTMTACTLLHANAPHPVGAALAHAVAAAAHAHCDTQLSAAQTKAASAEEPTRERVSTHSDSVVSSSAVARRACKPLRCRPVCAPAVASGSVRYHGRRHNRHVCALVGGRPRQ